MIGKVWIIGAGSEAGLITVRGLEALRGAQVVVYDDLLDHAILEEAQRGCELICAGKRKDFHKREQEEIHELLIDRARRGKKVVRLKGGDPTVFGRGGEEALALKAAGIPYEMIPGVSSCISAPEHMGIPVTHRGLASSFTVVTGHGAGRTAESYEVLAGLKGTLVFLMGHSKAGEIADGLMRAGMDPETPVSVLSHVYMPDEKRVDGILGELGKAAAQAQAPAILLIGKAAAMHLAPPEMAMDLPSPEMARQQPRKVLTVGTKSFTGKVAAALREDGLIVREFPCVEIAARGQEIPEDLSSYDWMVFTSANGVQVFLEELSRRKTDMRRLMHMKIACIGKGTAAELEKVHLYADLVPKGYTSEALSRELVKTVLPGEKILILRAEEGNPVLTNRLENEKILHRDCKIYRTQYCAPGAGEPLERYDYIVFGSAGGVRAFLEKNALPPNAQPVCIGPVTAAELARLTGKEADTAEEYSVEGIRQIIQQGVYDEKEI